MPATLSDIIFWLAALAAAIGQVAIFWTLRPTSRGHGTLPLNDKSLSSLPKSLSSLPKSLSSLPTKDVSPPSLSTRGAIRSLSKKEFGEVVWAVLPAVGLVAILVFTWRAIHPAAS
jgi:hypothetical protein